MNEYNAIIPLEVIEMERKSSDARIKASIKYNQNNTKQYPIRLNLNTDADIIEKLSTVDSVAGYIKDLIRADMKKNPRN